MSFTFHWGGAGFPYKNKIVEVIKVCFWWEGVRGIHELVLHRELKPVGVMAESCRELNNVSDCDRNHFCKSTDLVSLSE